MKRQYSLTAMLVVMSLTAVIVAVATYALQPAKYYTADRIHVSNLRVDKEGIDVEFMPFGETLYYCPGVSVERDGDTIDLYFHRERTNRDGVECEIPCVIAPDGKCSINVPITFSKGRIRVNGTKTLYSKGK